MWFPSLHLLQFTLKSATWSSFSLLYCTAAIRRWNSKITKTSGFTHHPSCVVAAVAWGFCCLSHASPCLPMNSHCIFPFSVILLFAQCGYKKREDIHTHACSFSRGGEKALGYSHCCQEWTQEHFSTATWEMQVGSRNESVPLVPTHTTRLVVSAVSKGAWAFAWRKVQMKTSAETTGNR